MIFFPKSTGPWPQFQRGSKILKSLKCQSLGCSYTQSKDVDEDSDQNLKEAFAFEIYLDSCTRPAYIDVEMYICILYTCDSII